MNFKKLSAIILASVMTVGMGTVAEASTMNVYIREWDMTIDNSKPTFPFKETPLVTVTGVNPNGTYQDALDLAQSQGLTCKWNDSYDEYLDGISWKLSDNTLWSKYNDGKNIDPIYDGDTMTGATWKGSSWMWYPEEDTVDLYADVSVYPDTTLGGTQVPSKDVFSVVLSYDTTQFKWGSALGD